MTGRLLMALLLAAGLSSADAELAGEQLIGRSTWLPRHPLDIAVTGTALGPSEPCAHGDPRHRAWQ